MTNALTLRELLAEITQTLRASANDFEPAREARILVQDALRIDATKVIIDADLPLSRDAITKCRDWALRRATGEPVAYLRGSQGFYKHEFQVRPGVLVPRPESEFIVTEALMRATDFPSVVSTLADLGCGTGCLGLSLLSDWPKAHGFFIDANVKAVELTKLNSELLGLGGRCEIVHKRVQEFSASAPLDVVVANPPYIAIGDTQVDAGVHAFEPHSALYAGEMGLAEIREWSAWAQRALRRDGVFVCEFGAGQSKGVRSIMESTGFRDCKIVNDLAGIPRVISGLR